MRSVFIKILAGMMILSFALWGTLNNPISKEMITWVIKVGEKKYDVSDFNRVVEEIRRERGIDAMEDSNDINDQAMERLINTGLLEEEARRLGIEIDDEVVKKNILSSPQFHDKYGIFNGEKFISMLKASGISEKEFIDDAKKQIAREYLVKIFSASGAPIIAPQFTQDIVQALYTDRYLRLFRFPIVDKVGRNNNLSTSVMIPEPKDIELEKFLKNNEENFRIPEKRTISYVVLDLDSMKKAGVAFEDVSENEILQEYNERSSNMIVPKQYDVKQIICLDKRSADQALSALKKGSLYSVVRKKYQNNKNDVEILKKIEIENLGNDVADELRNLKEGEVSNPIKTMMGWTVFIIEKIYPSRVKTIHEVRERLYQELRLLKSYKALDKWVSKIVSSLKSDKSDMALQNVSTTFKLDIFRKEIVAKKINNNAYTHSRYGPYEANFSSENRSDDGLLNDFQQILKSRNHDHSTIQEDTNFIDIALHTPLHAISEIIPVNNNSKYFILKVENIINSRIPILSEIRDQVKYEFIKSTIRDRALKSAVAIRNYLLHKNHGTNQKENTQKKIILASNNNKDNNKELKSTTSLMSDEEFLNNIRNNSVLIRLNRRNKPPKIIPEELLIEAFAMEDGEVGMVRMYGEEYVLPYLEKIDYLSNKRVLRKQSKESEYISSMFYHKVVFDDYIASIKAIHKVEINTPLLEKIRLGKQSCLINVRSRICYIIKMDVL